MHKAPFHEANLAERESCLRKVIIARTAQFTAVTHNVGLYANLHKEENRTHALYTPGFYIIIIEGMIIYNRHKKPLVPRKNICMHVHRAGVEHPERSIHFHTGTP